MNESRAGVITHSPPTQRQRRIPQRKRIDPRDANINGVSLHVQAVLRQAEMMFLGRSGRGGEGGITDRDNRQNQKSTTEPKGDNCLQQAKPLIYNPSNEKKVASKQQFYLKKG